MRFAASGDVVVLHLLTAPHHVGQASQRNGDFVIPATDWLTTWSGSLDLLDDAARLPLPALQRDGVALASSGCRLKRRANNVVDGSRVLCIEGLSGEGVEIGV